MNRSCESIGKNLSENAYFLGVPNIWSELDPVGLWRGCREKGAKNFWGSGIDILYRTQGMHTYYILYNAHSGAKKWEKYCFDNR